MENASKALIIAGAILLSILLISLGIMVYNNAKGTVNDANLDAETAQAFNTKFTQYGNKIGGSVANSLLDTVISSNAKSGHTVQINGAAAESTARFDKAKTYKVTYETSDGYVNNILITE